MSRRSNNMRPRCPRMASYVVIGDCLHHVTTAGLRCRRQQAGATRSHAHWQHAVALHCTTEPTGSVCE